MQYLVLMGLRPRRINTIGVPIKGGAGGFRPSPNRGVADVYVTLPPNGQACWIEVKRPTGRQSNFQKDFEREVTAHGAIYILARKLADVEKRLHGLREVKPTQTTSALDAERRAIKGRPRANVIIAGNHRQAIYWKDRLGLEGDIVIYPEQLAGRRNFDAYFVGEYWLSAIKEQDVLMREGRIVLQRAADGPPGNTG